MKIRLIKDLSGSSVKGKEYDLPDEVAKKMIAVGEAEEVTAEPKKRGRKKKVEE